MPLDYGSLQLYGLHGIGLEHLFLYMHFRPQYEALWALCTVFGLAIHFVHYF